MARMEVRGNGLRPIRLASSSGSGGSSSMHAFSGSDVGSSIHTDPSGGARVLLWILNCSVDNTLKVRVSRFLSHDLSAAQIRSFIRLAPCVFCSFNIQEKLGFWMPFRGSPDKFLVVVKRNFYLLTSDLNRVVKPNIELL